MVLVELSGLMTNQAQSARMHKKGTSVVNQSICRNRDVCLAASGVNVMFHNGLLFKKT